jgi:hypothetical protein
MPDQVRHDIFEYFTLSILEEIVREKLNPYGYTDVKDSVSYVRAIRKKSKEISSKSEAEDATKKDSGQARMT